MIIGKDLILDVLSRDKVSKVYELQKYEWTNLIKGEIYMLYFENDYSEGAHDKVLEALIKTNYEKLSGYGSDEYCEKAKEKIALQTAGQKSPEK